MGAPEKEKREDADDAVAYAWVIGGPEKEKSEDADDAVAYAWVVGAPGAPSTK